MFTQTLKQHIVMATATTLTVFALTACPAANAQPSTPPAAVVEAAVVAPAVVEIVTKDHHFEAPAQIEAGWVTIHLKNEGQEAHHMQLVRLNDGVTMEQFGATLEQGPLAALALVTLAGGPGPVEANGEQTVSVPLEAGSYLLLCFLPSADGVPHLAKGMIAPLQVVESDNAVAQAPQADAEVKLMEFSFALPQQITAGEQVWKVTAESTQPHELSLIKLAEGKTMVDVMHWMHTPEGTPPFINAGGLQAIDPGEAGYLHLNLTPGEYVAICHVPDAASGKEHAELGMVLPFTVKG